MQKRFEVVGKMHVTELAELRPNGRPPNKRKPSWAVRFGPAEWRRFSYDRSPEDNIQLLGSIRKGLQAGALARTRDGQYVMLVGDHETPLNASQMEKVLKNVPREFQVHVEVSTPGPNPAVLTPPVVTVKKRRVILHPDATWVV